jgi:hypothetical protein
MELDLYSNNLKIQVNVAPNMCQHLAFTPSWHWNYSVGRGPDTIIVRYNVDAVSGTETLSSCSASRADSGMLEDCGSSPTTGHPEILGLDESGVPICAYDHSRADPASPNCCLGSYNLVKQTREGTSGPFATVSTTPSQWGGNAQSCIGGPVRTGTGEFSQSSGYPLSTLIQVPEGGENGLNAETDIQANINGPKSDVSFPANFYTSDGRHTHSGYSSSRVTSVPYAFDPVDDLDGSPFLNGTGLRPGNAPYLFTCLDEAFDERYSISVYVREWNTVAEFNAYGSSNGASYDPDVGGTEGTDCPGQGVNCNDLYDFDDVLTENPPFTGQPYDTSTPNANIRAGYFPRVGF